MLRFVISIHLDNEIRAQAEEMLAQFEQANYTQYLVELYQVAVEKTKADKTREFAMVLMRKALIGVQSQRKVRTPSVGLPASPFGVW